MHGSPGDLRPRAARWGAIAIVVLLVPSCSFRVPIAGDDRPDVIAVSTDGSAEPDGSDGSTRPPGVPAGAQVAEVATVTDGDTLRVLVAGVNEAVRLLEVDAPETSGGCRAAEATRFVRRFVPPGSTVWLEPDVSDRDRYGRLLRYVWRDDAQLLNEQLVAAGWAEAKLYEPDDGRWPTMRRAQQRARDARLGIWEQCGMAGAPGEPRGSGDACDPNYSGCVPVHPPDVDCDRVDGPVTVLDRDPHNLDGNRDGRACEGPPP